MSKTMNYHNVKFAAAYGTSKQLPPSKRAEVSFVGRSNVGKSSLMNKLFNRKKACEGFQPRRAKRRPSISSRPNGPTSSIAGLWLRASFEVRKSPMARNDPKAITTKTANFCCVVSLIDIRHPATALDVNMIEFLIAAELPFMIVCTKADKLSKNKCARVNCRAAPPAGLLARWWKSSPSLRPTARALTI